MIDDKNISEKNAHKYVIDFIKDELTQQYGFVQSSKEKRYILRVQGHYLEIVYSESLPGGRQRINIGVQSLSTYINQCFIEGSILFYSDYTNKISFEKLSFMDANYKETFNIEEVQRACMQGIAPFIKQDIIRFFDNISYNGNTINSFVKIGKDSYCEDLNPRVTINSRLSYHNSRNGYLIIEFIQGVNNILCTDYTTAKNNLEKFYASYQELINVYTANNAHNSIKKLGMEQDLGNAEEFISIIKNHEDNWQAILKEKIALIEKDVMQTVWGIDLDENGNTIKLKKTRK